jgi:hypothetical protein
MGGFMLMLTCALTGGTNAKGKSKVAAPARIRLRIANL